MKKIDSKNEILVIVKGYRDVETSENFVLATPY